MDANHDQGQPRPGRQEASPEAPLVVHIIHRLAMGGMENGLVNLINHTPSDRYRHAIISLTDITDFRDRIREPGVECFALRKRPGKDLGVFVRLWRQLRALKPDIVHTRNMSAIECQAPAWLAGVKRRVHGEHGWDVDDLHGKNRKFLWMRRILALFIQRWIALSQHGRHYLIDKVGIDETKIRHICNGVDIQLFHVLARREDVLPEGFAPEGTLVFGTIGRLEVVKDHMNLVRAFSRLLETKPHYRELARLVLVGDGSQRQPLQTAVHNAGLDGQVWFAGARDDVPDMLNAFDVFVLPSLAEGISNTILEAMACGLPVVATNVGGNPDLVLDGETGRLVPASDPVALAEALAFYLDDAELAPRQALASRRRAESDFSLQVMVDKYLSVYDELTSHH